jgi:TonB family protein
MRLTLVSLCLTLLAALCAPALADDDAGALPSVEVMPCLAKCADFVPAVHILEPIPHWANYTADYVEALVRIRYTIGSDGHVQDASVVGVIGPKSFSDKAMDAVKQWTFQPATLDGKPVQESRTINFIFDLPNREPGARPEVVTAYKNAVKLIASGKLDEAEAELKKQQAKPDLNFYERGMMANLLGSIALRRKDFQDAAQQVKIATDFYTKELPPAVTIQLYKTRIVASLATGNLMDAMGATNQLKKVKGFAPDDPITNAVTDTRAQLNALPEFALAGKIPDAADADGQQLYLYRRDFGFAGIVGSLDKFDLSCKQQTVESKISDTAEWHVPRNWSQCYLFVRGAPGTTFKLVQFAPDQPAPR